MLQNGEVLAHLPGALGSHWSYIERLSRSCDLLRLCKNTHANACDFEDRAAREVTQLNHTRQKFRHEDVTHAVELAYRAI